jgi:hypothetical protein
MPEFLLGVVVLLLLLWAASAFIKADPKQVARVLRGIGGVAALLLAVFLIFRGAIGVAIPIGAFDPPFGLKPFMAGNTGVCMGGWFRREIKSRDDVRGLKLRSLGLGGEVYRRLGALPQTTSPGEILLANPA